METDSGPPDDQPDDQLAAGQQAPDEPAGGAEVTGVTQVDEAIAGLGSLPGRPLTEHVAVFEEAHAKLRQVLSDLDDSPADS
jgi:hypothetical protein